jgi:heat shock protein HslJ
MINSFSVQPQEINVGECVSLSWSVSGDAEIIRILRNGEVAFDNMPADGSGQDCFSSRGQVGYVLEATGVGETVRAEQSVNVILDVSLELESLANQEGVLVDPLPGTEITLEIRNDQISGNAGCNTYNGTYRIEGEELTIEGLTLTQQICEPEEIMQQEARYIELLQTANRFESAGDVLELILRRIDPASRQEVDDILLVFRTAD